MELPGLKPSSNLVVVSTRAATYSDEMQGRPNPIGTHRPGEHERNHRIRSADRGNSRSDSVGHRKSRIGSAVHTRDGNRSFRLAIA